MENKILIVAELSVNHNGKLETAIESIKAIKRTGANAVKLQTYTADSITIDCDKSDFQINYGSHWDGQTMHQLYQQAYTPWEWHEELFRIAREEGLICFSSPFDKSAVDFLEKLDNPIYKIASPEITDIPLIEYVASKKKPIILSTGVATKDDIQLAIDTCRQVENDEITVLKCTSSYPAPIEEANLAVIPDLATRFNVKVGLSDHTIGVTAPMVATALGATMIEKHFIIDRSIGGPDAFFSMNESEFTNMVKNIREVESSLGEINYSLTEKQLKSKEYCRSLYIVQDVKMGDIITEENVRSIRPGYGLHPKYLPKILGKKVNRDLKKGDRMSLEYLQE